MSKPRVDIPSVVARLPLGDGHHLQEDAVAAALTGLLCDGRRGVVLADEVGFGKTYEALAVMALLCDVAHRSGSEFARVLVLCKSSLLQKWQEEVSESRPGAGFPQYLKGPAWEDHPVLPLLNHAHVVERRLSADELRSSGLRGQRRDGKVQVPNGLYVVNHDLLSEKSRVTRPLLMQLWNTHWDLVIVDEAHHFARVKNQPAKLFAPDGNLRNYDQGISFNFILALTATPFELDPKEIVNLLALVRANPADLNDIENGLEHYVTLLNRFHELRQRSPSDTLRAGVVAQLRSLRDEDALGTGRQGGGLEPLLRKYLIRNTKSQNERRYFLVNKVEGVYRQDSFEKLDDLHQRVKTSPLLPFDGPDALFYLELRELIQETVDAARDGTDRRTFITTDLRQGLSSYPQVAASKLLQRPLESANRLRKLLRSWNDARPPRLHPKVRALVEIVADIAQSEVRKVRDNPQAWFSKVLVFSKLIEGTAKQLKLEVENAVEPIFETFLAERLAHGGLGRPDDLRPRFVGHAKSQWDRTRRSLIQKHGERCRDWTETFGGMLDGRCRQSLFLLRFALAETNGGENAVGEWVDTQLVGPLGVSLDRILTRHPPGVAGTATEELDNSELAVREIGFLEEDYRSVHTVGRYDGSNSRDREAHRRNFNDFYNPFVLLVSQVGEEGIDLQKQCRYVIHYDLEWNPARMEQREGRVDRMGWGRAGEKFIDVRFLLLKGTYEERIFHTVMQRDQWFSILIGSKRKELGEIKEGDGAEPDTEVVEEVAERGRLTPAEKQSVMLDLRPLPVNHTGGSPAATTVAERE